MRALLSRVRSQRGLALVSVLWGVSILALIASAMLSASRMTAHLEAGSWQAAQNSAIAEAAINRTVLSLMDSRGDRTPRLDGKPDTVAFGSRRVKIAVQDERGRIDLNFADAETLKSLFEYAGLSGGDASNIVDAILAARRPDPLHPPENPVVFLSVEDLLRVPHMTRPLYARVAPALTVYGHQASVDTNVAPRFVLLALPGMDPEKVDDLLKAREAQLALSRGTASSPPVTAAGHAFTITVALANGNVRTVRSAVVQFTGDPAKPFWFLAWD